MLKPETKLKKCVQKLVSSLSDFSDDKIPKLEDGSLDVKKFNTLPEVIMVKEKMIAQSKIIMGKNVVDNDYLFKSGFVVAGLILKFEPIENKMDIQSDYNPECEHDWKEGQCIECGKYNEPDDFSGATEGDR